MQNKVLIIDSEKCTGCRKCEMVCSVFHTGISNPARSLIKVMKWENIGFYLPVTCQSCEQAACVDVCPTRACHKDQETHKTVIDKDKCIGCRTCILACPFNVPFFDEVERVTVKCDFCKGDPQCVSCCEAKAITYVDAETVSIDKKRRFALTFSQLKGYI